MVFEATEEGELLALKGCELVVGTESVAETGELDALAVPANPMDQQAMSWCAALELPAGRRSHGRPARRVALSGAAPGRLVAGARSWAGPLATRDL